MSIKKHEKYAHKLSGYTLFPLLKLTFLSVNRKYFYTLRPVCVRGVRVRTAYCWYGSGNISIHCGQLVEVLVRGVHVPTAYWYCWYGSAWQRCPVRKYFYTLQLDCEGVSFWSAVCVYVPHTADMDPWQRRPVRRRWWQTGAGSRVAETP